MVKISTGQIFYTFDISIICFLYYIFLCIPLVLPLTLSLSLSLSPRPFVSHLLTIFLSDSLFLFLSDSFFLSPSPTISLSLPYNFFSPRKSHSPWLYHPSSRSTLSPIPSNLNISLSLSFPGHLSLSSRLAISFTPSMYAYLSASLFSFMFFFYLLSNMHIWIPLIECLFPCMLQYSIHFSYSST